MRNLMISTPKNIIQVIKSRSMRWAGYVARMGERRNAYRVWRGNLGERDQLKEPGVYEIIILRRIFRKWSLGTLTGSM